METENIILLSGLCATVVVITYILFGPPVHPSRKKGTIGGLVNVGETCFLNSLLQALSSMPLFVEWLSVHKNVKGSLIEALHIDLSVVNGLHPSIYDDPYLPVNVIRSLHRGWNIPCGEQDVHELFNVIMTTIEEEIKRSAVEHLSLSDALDEDENGNRPKRIAKMGTVCNRDQLRRATGDCHQEESVPTLLTYRGETVSQASSEFFNGLVVDGADFPGAGNTSKDGPTEHQQVRQYLQSKSEYTSVHKPVDARLRLIQSEATKLRKCPASSPAPGVETGPVGDWAGNRRRGSLPRQARRPARKNKLAVPPCEGFITTQTHCVKCHYRSPVKYDTFKYVPLLLPPADTRLPVLRLTLYNLLDKFISTEVVTDVECDGCNRSDGSRQRVVSNALKVSNFGKLPKCLAFHIQRTVWTNEGPYKRFDFVEFPEILSMGSYTYSEIQRRKLAKRSSTHADNEKGIINRSRNIYLLQAVIKHEGTVEKGHFVTYRRSPVRPKRWFCTSDSEVRETNLERVLEVPAYMVFYTRC